MANRVTTTFDFRESGGLKRIKADIDSATTATGKFKAGVQGLWAEFKNNRAAQAAVAGFVVLLGKQAVQAASDLEESAAAVQGTFGELGDEMLAVGEKSAESFGMSQRAFNEFAVRFSAFAKQIAERDGRSVIEVTEEMAQRVADFASRHNISLEEAAQVAQSTLAGETESFRRFGGNVSAATVEIFAYKNGIAETGEELTEGQKVLARYGAFMEQTANVAGDYKRTSDGLANSQRTLSAQVENLAAAYGEELSPAVAEVVQNLTDLTEVAGGASSVVGLLKNTAPIKLLSDYNNAVLDFIGVSGDAQVETSKWASEHLVNSRALFEAEFANQRWYETLRRSTRESTYNADANEEMGRIQAQVTKVIDKAREAQEKFLDSIKHTRDEVGALKREIDDQQAWINYLNTVDDVNAKLEDQETSSRDAMSAVLDLKEAVIEYAESINLPDRVVTNLIAQIDAGKAAEVTAFLERIQNGVTLPIRPEVRGSFNKASAARGGPTLTSEGNLIPRAARASGGPVAAGSTYLVGEQGPELLTMGSQSGNVIPNDKIGGASTTNVTINVVAPAGSNADEFGRKVWEAIRRESRWRGPI